jgi:hypothetical protein
MTLKPFLILKIMKRIFITLVLAGFLFSGTVQAQVIYGYGFESSISAYTEISGGTIVWQGADNGDNTLARLLFYSPAEKSKDPVVDAPGIPIGFDFSYDNQAVNRFVISAQGAIILGKDKVTANTDPAYLLTQSLSAGGATYWGAGNTGVIGTLKQGFPTDVSASSNTEIAYKTEGEAPQRILVVQFKNIRLALTNDGSRQMSINHQIRLYESSNKIEFIYNGWASNDAAAALEFHVGLKGSVLGDIHLRTSSWGESIQAPDSPDLRITDTRIKGVVSSGLTFTFTPPAVCNAPPEQVPVMVFDPSTSTGISGRFAPVASADHYLTVVSKSAALDAVPQEGRYYATGDALGNGTVIGYGTGNTFASGNLSSATTWYVHVFTANSYCLSGPKYNPLPLTSSVNTLLGPPDFFVKDVEYEKLTLSVTTGNSNQKVLIASSDKAAVKGTSIYQYGVFGTPSGTLNVGDEIAGGGKVIYKGEAPGDLVLENLESNTIYHYAAWGWDGNELYSSNSVTADSITWGKVPGWGGLLDYKNFKAYPNFVPLFGGESYGTKGFLFDRYQVLKCELGEMVAEGANNGFITQWIGLKEGSNRAFIDIQMQVYGGAWSPYNDWDERDRLQISVSEDGIDYIPVYTISKEAGNVPVFSSTSSTYSVLDFVFSVLNGKKVKLKVDWLTYGNTRMYVSNIRMEERPSCLPPLNPGADKFSLVGDKALITWTPNGDASVWEIRYRVKGSENWTPPVETETEPYLLTGLPYRSEIELQIRSKCSLTAASPWNNCSFTSGYDLPFSESFDASVQPAGWSMEKAELTATTNTFCNTGKFPCYIYWKVGNQALDMNYSEIVGGLTNSYQWAKLPLLDFGDGAVNYTFEYDFSVTPGSAATPATDSLLVVVSRDSGKTFCSADVIGRYSILDEETAGVSGGKVHRSIALKGYTGVRQLAFYAVGNGSERISVDNVGILETCPAATAVVVSETGGDKAKITWEGSGGEWLVFLREAGETTKDYQRQTGSEWLLTGLTPATAYEVGITRSCAEGDTARTVLITFTTLAVYPCKGVEKVGVEVSQTSATISWTAEAAYYNIKIRPENAAEWINRTTETTSFTIQGLDPDTKYEYSIQAVCSMGEGDYSDWLETAVFRTQAITCFPPSGLKTVPAHRSATVSWESEPGVYEACYRATNVETWTGVSVTSAGSVTFTGLTPLTAYSFRIRSICEADDISAWATGSFTTTDIPSCVAPFQLAATGITATSALLSWEADEGNLSWDVRYRLASGDSYTTLAGAWPEKNYLLQGLTPATVYVWSVRANCEENTGERWISSNFTTGTETRMDAVSKGAWNVFVSGKVINLLNPERIAITRIRLYDVSGIILQDYPVATTDNVLITASSGWPAVIMRVDGINTSATFKVFVPQDRP